MERSQDGTVGQDEVFALTLEQAAATLARRGVQVDLSGEDEVVLARVLQATAALLEAGGTSRVEPGTFFGPDGTELTGELVRVGQIAAFGLAGDQGGALLPSGATDLRVDRADPAAVRSWLETTGPSLQSLYLLDPTTRGQEASVHPGLWDQVLSGGALVWPILGLGVLAVGVALERLLSLWRHASRTEALLRDTLDLVGKGRVSEAHQLTARAKGAAARVLTAGLDNWHLDREHLEAILDEAVAREIPRLERFLPLLAVIAGVAPLLGLLGTVTGMIGTFDVITEHGTGDPKMLSGGISVALVTTQLGLGVAIPVLLAHNVLSSLVDRVSGEMLRAALAFNNAIHNQDFVRMEDGSWVARRGSDEGAGPHEGIGRKLPSASAASLVPQSLKRGAQ
ncbi:MAG: MotA/TolQ/ExbB proton channel family protein [Deltaproteobacteria bacterium]|nr:MotA/TolQ/ExbB proton channel family protein [Deltaproteobacteria bacterium]